MKHFFIFTALLLFGCVPAKDAAPVVALQRDAATALAHHCAQDQAALVAATAALLDIHLTASAARLEARALMLLFNQTASVTIGGLADEGAIDWLDRYESAPSAGERRALLSSLPDQQQFEQDADAVLDAVIGRGTRAAALFADLLDSTALLEAYADQSNALATMSAREVLGEIYTQELRERFDDPDKQAAADRIVDLILGSALENTP